MPSPKPFPGLTPLSSLRVSRHQIPSHNLLPNTSIHNWPLLIYHSAFPPNATQPRTSSTSSPRVSSVAIESHLVSVGIVEPSWRYSMYPTTHFHSNSHEVLCVACGRARLCFGGEDNPARIEPLVEAGDVIIVPAGVAHRLLEDLGGDFQMVGSYPNGSETWDMCYGTPEDEGKINTIKSLSWFAGDPIYGDNGPAVRLEQTESNGQL
jgi:uncharacterized protein YjlB